MAALRQVSVHVCECVCVSVGQQANPSIKCQSFNCNVHSSSIEIYCALPPPVRTLSTPIINYNLKTLT